MKNKAILLIILCAFSFCNLSSAQNRPAKIYDETIDPMEQIDKALAKAEKEGKFVICQVGGNWCPWCLLFADFMSKDNEIKSFVDKNYVFIHVNYNPRNPGKEDSAMLKRLGNPGRFGYPVFVVLDDKGNVIHIQDSSFLEEGKGYDKAKVMRFFSNWTPEKVNS